MKSVSNEPTTAQSKELTRTSLVLVPLVSTIVLYAASLKLLGSQMQIIVAKALLPDFLWQYLIAVSLYWACRSIWQLAALQTLLFALLYWTHAAKTALLGGPVDPYDFGSAPFLARIFWQAAPLWTAAISILLFVSLAFWTVAAVRESRWPYYLVALSLLSIPFGVAAALPNTAASTLDAVYGERAPWQLTRAVKRRGASVFFVGEIAHYYAARSTPPSRESVESAIRLLSTSRTTMGTVATSEGARSPSRRNVYILVVEAFWDPKVLPSVASALHTDFEDLWRESGHSTILSPTLGGGTAEAEFEILCGHPATRPGIEFMKPGLEHLRCLPRVLFEKGYNTVAYHPNVATFWNRDYAYRAAGFDRYFSITDFQHFEGPGWLPDASLYAQSDEIADRNGLLSESRDGSSVPLFSYTLTAALHWPFLHDLESSPDGVELDPAVSDIVRRYANAVHDASRALAARIHRLRQLDPNALILAFGDHLPALGQEIDDISEGERNEWSAKAKVLRSSTPLVVLDGKRGGLDVGAVSMHIVPAIVTDLLGLDLAEEPLSLTTNPPASLLRWNLEGALLAAEAASVVDCSRSARNPACVEAGKWAEALQIIDRDLRSGQRNWWEIVHKEQ